MTSPPDQSEEVYWGWSDATLFAGLLLPSGLLAFGLMRGLTMVVERMGSAAQVLSFQFIGYGIWLTTLYLLLWLRYRRPFWSSMGWRVPWPGAITSVFYGPLLAVFVALAAAALKTPPGSTIQDLMRDRISIALIGLFSATLGPLCEELVFRGFFQPLLIRTFGTPFGIVLCAAPFALLHGPQYHWSWQIVVLLVLAGVVFGYVRLRTGSTAASALVHATYNLTFFAGYLLQRKDFIF